MDKFKWIIIGIIVVLIILCFFKPSTYKNEPKVITTTIEDSINPEKLQKLINKNSDANLNKYQTREITNTITKIIEQDKKPDSVVQTTGNQYKNVSQEIAKQQKVDAVVVTPSKGEEKKIEDIKETDVVNLNQYNIKAYPKHMASVSVYSDHDIAIDYETQVKVFGKHMYVGPTVKHNTVSNETAIGVKVTVPF